MTGPTLPLADAYGRVATDLRVSLTDKCNLRCTYCMPAEGLDWMPTSQQLTDDEVVRLIGVAVGRLGVREVRFTGGEPLVRRGLVDIVARTKQLPAPDGPVETSLTTNGLGLAKTAAALAEAGLDRVNVSLDSVRPETFLQLTRRDRLHDVVAGLEGAAAAGLGPVKVNAVLMRGVNDDQAAELLGWCLERGYELRFIEQMPLDAQHGWSRDDMVTADEILATLETAFVLTPAEEPRGSAPAERFLVDGGPATVGVIASVTRPFCGDCDRVRLTADGQVRTCLFAREESDLRGGPARRRLRRRAGRALARGHARQGGRPRHRRPVVPAADAADVSDRRLGQPRPPVPARAARRHAGTDEHRGTATAARGARRTPATPCAARRRAASGCSTAAATSRARDSPSTSRRQAPSSQSRRVAQSSRRWPDSSSRRLKSASRSWKPSDRFAAALAITTAM